MVNIKIRSNDNRTGASPSLPLHKTHLPWPHGFRDIQDEKVRTTDDGSLP